MKYETRQKDETNLDVETWLWVDVKVHTRMKLKCTNTRNVQNMRPVRKKIAERRDELGSGSKLGFGSKLKVYKRMNVKNMKPLRNRRFNIRTCFIVCGFLAIAKAK